MPGQVVIRNALAEQANWSGSNFWTEPRFPASNLVTGTPGRVARWRADRMGDRFMVIEFPLQTVSTVAILNANIVSAPDLVVRVAATSDALIGGGGISIPIPEARWKDGSAYVQTVPIEGIGAMMLTGGETIKTEGDKPLQIGSLWLGSHVTLPSSMQWGDERGADAINEYAETDYGVPLVRHLTRRRVFRGALRRGLTEDEAAVVQAIFDAGQGRAKPFLFIPEIGELDVIQGRLGSDSFRTRSLIPGRVDAIELVILEDPWGETGA